MRGDDASRTVGSVVWGTLLIWTGVALLLGAGWGIGLVGAGAILLAGEAARAVLRLKLDGFALVAGIVLAVCGVGDMVHVAVDVFPILFIVAGLALLVSTLRTRAARPSGGSSDLQAQPHPRP